MLAMAILELQRINELNDFETEWNQLLSHSLDNNPFLTYEWLTSWWKQYGKGRTLKLFTANSRDGATSLFAPIMYSTYKRFGIKLRKAEFVATPDSDYHTFLVTNYQEATKAINPLIESIMEDLTDADSFRLGDVPEDSYTAKLLENINLNGVGTNRSIINTCPYVTLPNNHEIYLQTLGPHMRKSLKRCERQALKDYKVEFVKYDKIGTVKEAMKIFFELHQKRQTQTGETGLFAESTNRSFHLDVANAFAEKGWLALFFLTFNDEPVSGIYCYEYNKKLYFYLSGFNPEYATYRPGHLAIKNLIKYGIEKGLKEFDFLRGNETYKSLWGTKIRRNLEFRIPKKSFKAKLYNWTANNPALPYLYAASALPNRFLIRTRSRKKLS
jgi:CelD/BcsL family acetyltransferase involved in cellulose biosynthesis